MTSEQRAVVLATFIAGQHLHATTMQEAVAAAANDPERLKTLAAFAVPMLLRGQQINRELFPIKYEFKETATGIRESEYDLLIAPTNPAQRFGS
jgi:hypothetical protein